MSYHSYTIANQPGLSFRADLNNALAAIVSQNSASTAPAVSYAYQLWVDTSVTPALLRIRNAANTAWIVVGDTTQVNLGLTTNVGVQQELYSSAVATGTSDAIVGAFTPAITSATLASGAVIVNVRATASNLTTTPTFTPNSGVVAPATIVKGNNLPLQVSDISGSGHWMMLLWDTTNSNWVLLNPAFGVTVTTSTTPPVRQTVLSGVTNSSGYANMLSAGSGLTLNLAATATPMKTAFAQGTSDFIATLSADTNSVVTLPVNVLSFVRQDYVGPTSVTWSSTLAPPQYGYTYNQSAQSVLQFAGSAGSTTFLDDFGNTWVAQGNAKVQTNQFKFGTGALGGGGTSNALNGTGDYIKSTSFVNLGSGGWALRLWVYPTSLSASLSGVLGFQNASGYGILLDISNTGKTNLNLSSTGSSFDIAGATTGSVTVTANTWNFIELTFDPVAGKYFSYINGTLDQTITSSLRICSVGTIQTIGARGLVSGGPSSTAFTGYIDKFEFLPYCQHPNGTTYSVPTSAPSVVASGYASDWINTATYTVYQVSGASTVTGNNPTFTAKNRVYVAEATTTSVAVSSVVNYAFQRKYVSPDTGPLPAAGTAIVLNSNLGCTSYAPANVEIVCQSGEAGYTIGDVTTPSTSVNGSFAQPFGLTKTRNTVKFGVGASVSFYVINPTTGALVAVNAPNWKYRVTMTGGW